VYCDEALKLGTATRRLLGKAADSIARAAAAERFTGKSGSTLDLVLPADLKVARLSVVGVGKAGELKPKDYLKLGGVAAGKAPSAGGEITVVADLPDGAMRPEAVADLATGARLRTYSFDLYKTRRKEGEEKRRALDIAIAVANPGAAGRIWTLRGGVAAGVVLARDLINEPPNVLYPAEFARRVMALRKIGVIVDVLDVPAMKRLGMGSLLAVGQGSAHDSRLVVMRWNGGKRGAPPAAFIGKGVCFDTGGISIKPAQGMEDMKGDMAGAACVVGLMHALAARKAKVNAVGIIGLVENMPDGKAQRPPVFFMSANLESIILSYSGPSGIRQTRSPVASPALVSRSTSLSLLENIPAYSWPSATMMAPVSVARLIMNFGLKRLFT